MNSSGEFVAESFYSNGVVKSGGLYHIDHVDDVSSDSYIWMGIFVKQWGHFLLDCINRLWFICSNQYKGQKIAYISNENEIVDGNYLRFFELLGIKEDQIIRISMPTKVKEIIIPGLSFVKREYYTDEYLSMFETAVKNIENTKDWDGASVYFSRNSFSHGFRAKDFGQEAIKINFQKNAFVCIEPQDISLDEQICIWNNAKTIACINGSIPLNMLFCVTGFPRVVVCNKTSKFHANLHIVEAIKNRKVVYIDVFDKKRTDQNFSLGRGPFLCTVTTQFQNFLHDNYMKVFKETRLERCYRIFRYDIARLYRKLKK